MDLVDTMVLSERSKANANPNVLQWLSSIFLQDIFVSVVTLGEIRRGIHKLELREGRKAERHRAWLDATIKEYSGRVLPISLDVALRWGPLTYKLKRTDPDLLIAATALEHDFILVTRNVRHFQPAGVKLLNPYE